MAVQKNDLEIEASTKQQEIHALIQSSENLDREVQMGLEQLNTLENENLDLKKAESLLRDEVETLQLEVRSERERSLLQENRMATL